MSLIFLGCFVALTSNCHWLPDYKYTNVPINYIAEPKIIPVYIDNDFLENEKIQIDNAITQWNYVLNGWVVLQVIDEHFQMDIQVIKKVEAVNNGIIILRVLSDSTLIPDDGFLAPGSMTAAWTHGTAYNHGIGGHEVYLIADRLTDPVTLQGVTLHELGHALGAAHHKEREISLMNPSYDTQGNSCVDKWSSERVAEFQHLPAQKMNYCIY